MHAAHAEARRPLRLSLRRRLALAAVTCAALVAVTVLVSLHGLAAMSQSAQSARRMAGAQRAQQDADMMHDAIHASVLQALILRGGPSTAARARIATEVAGEAGRLRADLQRADAASDQAVRGALASVGPELIGYTALAERLIASDRGAAAAERPAFEQAFARLAGAQAAVTARIDREMSAQVGRSGALARRALRDILLLALLAFALMAAIAYFLGRSVARSLASISTVTDAIVRGDRTARHAHPSAGAPGCDVTSPFSCVAVRRGSATVFDSSEALNACPHLRARSSGPCSAVCVPVTFMGRALGVLHATGPDAAPVSTAAVSQMTVLAEQAGSRIGTVRAFEKTQLQATTDPLTGALNRRSLENELRSLLVGERPFAIAMIDLDHFKLLNDVHGHDAGDRALRLFTRVVKATVRDADVVARYGGEEFVVLFPSAMALKAADVLERVREALSESLAAGEHPVFTFSAGVTDSRAAGSSADLLRIADHSLYAAKAAGRDRTRVADVEDPGPGRPGPDRSAADGDPEPDTVHPAVETAGPA